MGSYSVNVLSLCTGAGALDAGLKLALPTARTVCYVENEATALGVLAKGIKAGWVDDAPIWTDLKTFDFSPWRGIVDGIIGGYPCQPFSVAGKHLGTDDPRHLWPFIEEGVKQLKPSFCFFENVPAHLKLGYSNIVRPSLETMGYEVAEGLFTAAEVGAPHIRRRLFILCYRSGQRLKRPIRGGADEKKWSASLERFVGWPPEPNVGRVANGLALGSDRVRVLGNGIVPVVAAKAFVYLAAQLLGVWR